mmetsp:Transcript_53394/g.134092  ORF Transcript_53394/g.134092 Transcript_53394/m.134092 type:complete len:454 (+) Transcript_53394:76-1437(+)
MAGELRSITSEEVAKHATPGDCWLIVRGHVYDVSQFASIHPGGDIIHLGAGIDATILFESYHLDGVDERRLEKYRIGKLANPTESFYTWDSDFYPTLRSRVSKYFKDNNLSHRGDMRMYLKTLLIMTCWCLTYYYGVIQDSLLVTLFFGFWSAEIGLSIQHDGSHGAYSNSPLLNRVAAWGMDLIGASTFAWEYQHIVGHHAYTNLVSDCAESDSDVLAGVPFMRMHDSQQKRWHHRYQHIFGPALFSLLTINKVFVSDIQSALTGECAGFQMDGRYGKTSNKYRFWLMKLITIVQMVVIPVYLHGVGRGLLHFLLAHMVCGEFLATVFVVTHISSDVVTLNASKGSNPISKVCAPQETSGNDLVTKRDWAALQVATSVNWALDSKFWTFFSGGLNHQIEHHLFPGITHVHYSALAPIVRRTCEEFNVPYVAHPDLPSAYGSLTQYLRTMGNQ